MNEQYEPCPHCGYMMLPNDPFCPSCGQKKRSAQPANARIAIILAGIVALLVIMGAIFSIMLMPQ